MSLLRSYIYEALIKRVKDILDVKEIDDSPERLLAYHFKLYSKNDDNFNFEDILKEPEKWNWQSLSQNQNITWDMIDKHPELPWIWKYVLQNKNVTAEIVSKNPEKPWDWYFYKYECNPKNFCIPWEIVKNNLKEPWKWSFLSKYFTWDVISNNFHPKYRWDWDYISINPNITIEIINENIEIPWNWENICECNPNVTMNKVLQYPELPWDWNKLTFNKNMKWKYICNYPGYDWNLMHIFEDKLKCNIDVVCKHKDFKWDFKKIVEYINKKIYNVDKKEAYLKKLWKNVIKYPFYKWPWKDMSKMDVPSEVLLKTKDQKWNWSLLENIPWEIIRDKHDVKWDWKKVSLTAKITIDDYIENPEYQWHKSSVFLNKNIVWDDKLKKLIDILKLEYTKFSAKKNFPIEYIKENIKKAAEDEYFIEPRNNWQALTLNNDLETIIENQDLPWDREILTRKILKNYDDPWSIIKDNLNLTLDDFYMRSRKIYMMPPADAYELTRRFFAARTIQHAFRKANEDPEYLLCQRRLLREFKSLSA